MTHKDMLRTVFCSLGVGVDRVDFWDGEIPRYYVYLSDGRSMHVFAGDIEGGKLKEEKRQEIVRWLSDLWHPEVVAPAQPHRDYVVIDPVDAASHRGIALPEAYLDEAEAVTSRDYIREWNRGCLGVVVAVGPGYTQVYDDEESEFIQPDCEPGEVVFYERGPAQRIEWPGHPDAVIVRSDSVYFAIDGGVKAVLGGLESVNE